MEHTKHIWRAMLIIIAIAVVYSVGRHFLIPASFGVEGFYRADARTEFMSLPVVHGGKDSCAPCHAEQQERHDGGKHAPVNCEVCHGPQNLHAANGDKIADMPIDKSRTLCQQCHLKLRARPEGFPQIDPEAHLVDQGAMEPGDAIPDESCGLCHTAHDPAQE